MAGIEGFDDRKFPERLRLSLGSKSARAFALEAGLSTTVFHQYLSGKSEPTRLAVIAIAKTADVNIEWLATGEGPMKRGEETKIQVAGVDGELLEAVIEGVEEQLASIGKPATPKQRAQLILTLYDLARERENHTIDRTTTLRLVKLMAA